MLGGLVGAAFGAAIVRAAPSLIPPGLLPEAVTIGFDGRVLTFCAVAALVVAVLYGLVAGVADERGCRPFRR